MPTTEELGALPVVQPTQGVTIITKQCSWCWTAWLAQQPTELETGPSEAEAVFSLLLQHSDRFGIIQRLEQP